MAASHPPHDPDGDAFLDALAGLDSVCRYLALVLGEAARPGGPAPGDAPGDGPGEEIIDALLGLVSVHRTVSLLLAAVPEMRAGEGAGPPAPEAPAAWSREVLR